MLTIALNLFDLFESLLVVDDDVQQYNLAPNCVNFNQCLCLSCRNSKGNWLIIGSQYCETCWLLDYSSLTSFLIFLTKRLTS